MEVEFQIGNENDYEKIANIPSPSLEGICPTVIRVACSQEGFLDSSLTIDTQIAKAPKKKGGPFSTFP